MSTFHLNLFSEPISVCYFVVPFRQCYFCDFYRPKRSFGQGNIFTPVCHSVHRGGLLPDRQSPPPETRPPPPRDQSTPSQDQTPPPPRTRPHPPPHPAPSPGTADSGIRSTIGRYASYWNAFLCILCFDLPHLLVVECVQICVYYSV